MSLLRTSGYQPRKVPNPALLNLALFFLGVAALILLALLAFNRFLEWLWF